MPPDSLATAKASFTRCQASADFLPAFYRNFFAACPGAKPLFAATDLERQAKLLQHAIGLLLVSPDRQGAGPNVLERLAQKHGPGGLDIRPDWYPVFGESLITTVAQFDPEFTPATGDAWRQAITPGLAYMQAFGRSAG